MDSIFMLKTQVAAVSNARVNELEIRMRFFFFGKFSLKGEVWVSESRFVESFS